MKAGDGGVFQVADCAELVQSHCRHVFQIPPAAIIDGHEKILMRTVVLGGETATISLVWCTR